MATGAGIFTRDGSISVPELAAVALTLLGATASVVAATADDAAIKRGAQATAATASLVLAGLAVVELVGEVRARKELVASSVPVPGGVT